MAVAAAAPALDVDDGMSECPAGCSSVEVDEALSDGATLALVMSVHVASKPEV